MSSGVVILDASAALAYLFGERGGEAVLAELGSSVISAVNWAEVGQRAMALGAWTDSLRSEFESTGAQVVPVEAGHAEHAALLREPTRSKGLSLADRICFALAASLNSPVMTADRAWAKVDVGVEVLLIR
jgi:PIN domain nuclease of toxin-antitoxin system